jgi:magnesium-transporting ATPase (P-type)
VTVVVPSRRQSAVSPSALTAAAAAALPAAGASLFLAFLPMRPSQILLNNLLYDTSQLAIPTDHVDPEQVARPASWDVGFIRRFMLFFGPLSSVFDFITFGVMLWGSTPAQHCSGPAGSWSPGPPRPW